MAIIQRTNSTPKIMLTKDIQTIFTAKHETLITMVHVENIGQLNRRVYFYTEIDELISEHSLSAGNSLAFNFSDNEYVINEGIKAKQDVKDDKDVGNDINVVIGFVETIII